LRPMPKPRTAPLTEEVLAAERRSGRAGITSQQLALKLGIKDMGQRHLVFDAIDALLDDGRIEGGKKGRYVAVGGSGAGTAEGVIDIISSGAGYVRLPDTDAGDVYIPQRALGTALHGDTVRIKAAPGRSTRTEGRVLEVIERRRTEFVGVLHRNAGRNLVVADDQRVQRPFLIAPGDMNGATDGDKVIMELGTWKDARDMPRGRVLRVLGRAGEHQVEMHAILAEFGLPLEFPESVLRAAEAVRNDATPAEFARRRDVRDVPTVTIDPEDAKDLDDALSLRKLPNGHWEVGVHIADVSHYVTPGSVIDMEAAARATSVYLVDRVVPMLPEKLSNDLCSLHPGTDKLSFSAIFELDDRARVQGEWFGRTVMHADRRLSYAQAHAIIEGKGEGTHQPEVLRLHQLAQVLRKDRIANGALEIGGNEVKFLLDAKGKPLGVYEKMMGPANWLIEEFMLLANKRVAAHVGRPKRGKPKPFVYRVHDLPDPEKVEQLRTLARSFGHQLDTSDPRKLPHAINRLLHAVKDREEEGIIKQTTIRSMSKAVYATENIGHYGLAFTHYTHFTSPIRRYPDLLVHRAMAHYLAGGGPLDQETLELSCQHGSRMEKQAADAERASVRYKQAEFLRDRIGEEFAGTISGLTNWGIYVELTENKCEGLVAMRELPGDAYRFDPDRYEVVGRRTGRRFRLGDEVQVTIKAVDMDRRTVDMALVGDPGGPVRATPQRPEKPVGKPVKKAGKKPGKKGGKPGGKRK
jgi:ribonuclease R